MSAEYTEHIWQEYHYKGYEPIHQREEIVRCVDCAYFKSETDKFPALCRLWLSRNLSKQYGIEPDGFCAWGERKEQ